MQRQKCRFGGRTKKKKTCGLHVLGFALDVDSTILFRAYKTHNKVTKPVQFSFVFMPVYMQG